MIKILKITVVNALLFISGISIGQEIDHSDGLLELGSFRPESHNINIGIGLVNAKSSVVNIIGIGEVFTAQPSPAFNLQYEYALDDVIGIGVYFDYYRVNADIEIPPIDDILDDPLCVATCILGINTANCNCNGYEYTDRVNVYTLAGSLAYHKQVLDKLDTYISVIAGYSFNRRQSAEELLIQQVLRESKVSDNLPTFIYKASLGAKYYASEHWGIYGEFGWSNTHLVRCGLTFRI